MRKKIIIVKNILKEPVFIGGSLLFVVLVSAAIVLAKQNKKERLNEIILASVAALCLIFNIIFFVVLFNKHLKALTTDKRQGISVEKISSQIHVNISKDNATIPDQNNSAKIHPDNDHHSDTTTTSHLIPVDEKSNIITQTYNEQKMWENESFIDEHCHTKETKDFIVSGEYESYNSLNQTDINDDKLFNNDDNFHSVDRSEQPRDHLIKNKISHKNNNFKSYASSNDTKSLEALGLDAKNVSELHITNNSNTGYKNAMISDHTEENNSSLNLDTKTPTLNNIKTLSDGSNVDIIENDSIKNDDEVHQINNIYSNTKDSVSALNKAVKECNCDLLQELLKNPQTKLIINTIDPDGCTVLLNSIIQDNPKIFQELINAGAKIDIDYFSGQTSLHYAVEHSCNIALRLIEIIVNADKQYLSDSAKPQHYTNTEGENNAQKLVDAIVQKDKSLLDKGNKLGTTPLMVACSKGSILVCNALINAGINISAIDNDGNTALHYIHATSENDAQKLVDAIVQKDKILLDKGNKLGVTPLMVACSKGSVLMCNTLLKAGARPEITDVCDGNALHHIKTTSENDAQKLVDAIVQKDKSLLNEVDLFESTPLMVATKENLNAVCNALINAYIVLEINNENIYKNDYQVFIYIIHHNNHNIGLDGCISNIFNIGTYNNYLYEYGAITSFKVIMDYALELAIFSDNATMFEYLIKKCIKYSQDKSDLLSALHTLESNIKSDKNKHQSTDNIAKYNEMLAALDKAFALITQDIINNMYEYMKNIARETNKYGNKRTVVYGKEYLNYVIIPNINKQNSNGCTSLYLAAQDDDLQLLDFFIRSDANINELSLNGLTALHIAVQCHSNQACKELVKKLLADKGSLEVCDPLGRTPLYFSVVFKNDKACQMLIDAGANVDAIDASGKTALHAAIDAKDSKICQMLIDAKADEKKVDNEGKNALHHASLNDFAEVAEYLGNVNSLNVPDNNGDIPLIVAIECGSSKFFSFIINSLDDFDYETLSVIINAKCNVYKENNKEKYEDYSFMKEFLETALQLRKANHIRQKKILYEAIDQQNLNKVQKLIIDIKEIKEFMKECGENEYAPLFVAIRTGNAEICRALINAGADTNASSPENEKPLHIAIQYQMSEICHILINNPDTDCNILTKSGLSSLSLAIANNISIEVIDTLFTATLFTTILNEGDKSGNNVLHYIAKHNRYDVYKLLKQKIALGNEIPITSEINTRNAHGKTPLHIALDTNKNNHCYQLIIALLDDGAALEIADAENRTPLDYLKIYQNNNTDTIMQYIKKNCMSNSANKATSKSPSIEQGYNRTTLYSNTTALALDHTNSACIRK